MEASIRNRLILGISILLIVPLLLTGIIIVTYTYYNQRVQAISQQVLFAQQIASDIRASILAEEAELRAALQYRDLNQLAASQKERVLLDFLATHSTFEALTLYNNAGWELTYASSSDRVSKITEDERKAVFKYITVDTDYEIYYNVVLDGPGRKDMVIIVGIPLFNPRTDLLNGLLIAKLNTDLLTHTIRGLQADQSETVYILGGSNQVIFHPDVEFAEKDIRFYPGNRSGIRSGLTGESRLVVSSNDIKLGGMPFHVVAEKPLDAFLMYADYTLAIFFWAALLIIVAGGAFGLVFIRGINEPIVNFTKTMENISRGNLSQWVEMEQFRFEELGVLSRAVNRMTTFARQKIATLELQIQDDARALEVSMEISSRITVMKDLDKLLEYVVNRIQTGYNFYHTQIYLVEEDTGDLVMAMGYGPVGQQMKKVGHRLKSDEGIVGTVASTNQAFMSNNVADLINFVANSMLPHTKSEIAAPLRVGNKVVGVLDIQSSRLNQFGPQDLTLVQSLADQTAVAIDNIHLVEGMQASFGQIERLNRRLTREGWDEVGQETFTSGYRYSRTLGGVIPDSDAWLSAMEPATQQRKLAFQQEGGSRSKVGELAIPLMLRGEVIGALGVKRDEIANWNDDEVTAIEAVANQVSLALENARLSMAQGKTIYKLKEVDRLKSDFLASMSHELRTPLNSIIGFADILLQGIDGPLSEHAETDITAIHNSGKHLLALINGILDMSKIEAGRMELACNALVVADIFDEVSVSVSALLKEKPVQLIQNAAPDLPDVWADHLRLTQVVINLVSNAIKFTDEGNVVLSADLFGGKFVHITVQDTGIGIPKDKFDLVFEHFRQVDSRNNRKYQGTGMGLAIAKQLVELHGGEMWLESEVGHGSTFHFTVPIASEENLVTING